MSSLESVRQRLLAARDVHARLVAIRDRADRAARALDGDTLGVLPPELEAIATRLDDVAVWLDGV